jgi:hypothetical protein
VLRISGSSDGCSNSYTMVLPAVAAVVGKCKVLLIAPIEVVASVSSSSSSNSSTTTRTNTRHISTAVKQPYTIP